jgi:hypothetical protein
MVLGASNYAYPEVTATQSASDFIEATAHGFEYFGCLSRRSIQSYGLYQIQSISILAGKSLARGAGSQSG